MNRKQSAIALAAILFITGAAQAGTYTVVGGQVENDSIAIGKSSEASSPKDASVSSVAVGKSANATGEGSIAIGDSAQVKRDPTNTKENLDGSIAIGRKTVVKTTRGTAIGSEALVEGQEASAFGTNAQATKSLSLAIGSYAKSFVERGVALGASSVADRTEGIAGYDFSTGTSTSNTSPVWKSTWGAVSVGKGEGNDEKTRQIIHVAAGSEDTDAVNVAQLKASQTTLTLASGESTLNLTESKTVNGTSYALSLDTSALQSSKVAAGTGVSVSQSGSTYTVSLNSDQTFGTATATNFKSGSTVTLNSAGLALTSGPSVTTSGISAGSKTITNVLAGTSDTDAVNVAQLKASKSSLALESGESNLELSSSSSPDGTSYTLGLKDEVSFTKVTASDSMSIGSSLTLSESTIQVGSAVALSTTGLAITGGPTVTATGINAGSLKITAVATGVSDTDAVNVAQLKQTVKESKSSLIAGSNTSISSAPDTDGGTKYTVSLDNAISLTSVTTGNSTLNSDGLTITDGPSVTTSGISASNKKITQVAKGENDTDAVNVEQLNETVKNNKSSVAGGSGIQVSQAEDTENGGTRYTVSLDSAISFDSVTTGSSILNSEGLTLTGGPSVTTSGISAGNKKITQVAEGENDDDAVNLKQLKSSKSDLNLEGTNTNLTLSSNTDENGTHYTLGLVDSVSLNQVTTNSLVIGTSGVTLTNQGLTLGISGPYFTTSGISAGGQQINNVLAGVADTDAVNVGQLNKSKSDLALASGTTNLTLNSTTDANGTHYELGLNGSLEFDRVTAGNTTISSDGFSITGGPSMTGTGINASNKTISNVAAGTEASDAVNKGQMEDYVEQKKSTVTAGTGISVAETTNSNGGTNYEISLDDDISFDSVSTGDTKVSDNGVSIDNGPSMTKTGIDAAGTKVTQVADGESDTDAVNVSQLNKAKSRVKAKENGNLKVTSTSSENGTEYEVSLEDSVAVNEVQVGENVRLSSEGIRVGERGPAMTESGFDAGGNVISNVAAGVRPTDAVNLGQMNSAMGNIYRQIHSVDKDARAGIAMAIATAGLPQAYLPGKSMFAISGGTYRGQSGYAIGFSHVTDKGRVVIKATGSGNSQGHFGGSVGVGWQW